MMDNKITYKAIPIEDYYVIVSDALPKNNDTFLDLNSHTVNILFSDKEQRVVERRKVIAQSIEKHKGIPLFDVPDEWLQDDADALAEKILYKNILTVRGSDEYDIADAKMAEPELHQAILNSMIEIYNHHASTHPFTEKDIEKAIGITADHVRRNGYGVHSVTASVVSSLLPKVLSSIQQPKQRKEYDVELEMTNVKIEQEGIVGHYRLQPKITEGKIKILSWK